MTAIEPMTINCGPHGERISAVVCKHLLQADSAPLGVVENSNDPNDLQSWCYLCEEKFQFEGEEITDAFKVFNGMSIVCIICYKEILERHTVQIS